MLSLLKGPMVMPGHPGTASGEVGTHLCLEPHGRSQHGMGSTGLPAPEPQPVGTAGQPCRWQMEQ